MSGGRVDEMQTSLGGMRAPPAGGWGWSTSGRPSGAPHTSPAGAACPPQGQRAVKAFPRPRTDPSGPEGGALLLIPLPREGGGLHNQIRWELVCGRQILRKMRGNLKICIDSSPISARFAKKNPQKIMCALGSVLPELSPGPLDLSLGLRRAQTQVQGKKDGGWNAFGRKKVRTAHLHWRETKTANL